MPAPAVPATRWGRTGPPCRVALPAGGLLLVVGVDGQGVLPAGAALDVGEGVAAFAEVGEVALCPGVHGAPGLHGRRCFGGAEDQAEGEHVGAGLAGFVDEPGQHDVRGAFLGGGEQVGGDLAGVGAGEQVGVAGQGGGAERCALLREGLAGEEGPQPFQTHGLR